jgi:hypothetical protein
MITEPVTIILGDEYDDNLRVALRAALVESGAIGLGGSWGVGGSQEIETLEVTVGDALVTIESETFVGLTVTGPKPVVERIAESVLQKRKPTQGGSAGLK